MKNAGKSVTIAEFQLSKQIVATDDAAANEVEVEEQIEEDNVKKQAHENQTSNLGPVVRGSKQMTIDDNATAAEEEIEEQAEESRIDKEAFEGGMSTASAKEYIRRVSSHD